MDAVTSLELEAQRRRETVAGDRDVAWARALATQEALDPMSIAPERVRTALAGCAGVDRDCQPGTLARQSAG